jgi:hypothetical protein
MTQIFTEIKKNGNKQTNVSAEAVKKLIKNSIFFSLTF